MQLIKDVFIETAIETTIDSVRMLPFLFAAFLALEALEHYSGAWVNRILTKVNKAGPAAGALLGCIPQCGFSVMAANLYAGGIISPGTLLSVFLATSDEAILILLGNPGRERDILWLLLTKVLIAIIAGYLVDMLLGRKIASSKHIEDLCHRCGCHNHHGILRPALNHTCRLFLYIFVFSGILNILIEALGVDTLSALLLGGSIFQPFIAAVIGFIPNCAASVILTELYLSGAMTFASVIAGLCTNAGVGLIVLCRVNKNRAENLKLIGLLYLTAVLSGMLLSILLPVLR